MFGYSRPSRRLASLSLYHTNSRGPDLRALARAVAHAVSLANQAGHNTCRIAVHTIDSLRMGGFSIAFGSAFVQAVTGNSGATLQSCRFYLTTERITPSVPPDSPIIAAHVSPAWLTSLIASRGQAPVIYLPWTPSELQTYLGDHPNSQEV